MFGALRRELMSRNQEMMQEISAVPLILIDTDQWYRYLGIRHFFLAQIATVEPRPVAKTPGKKNFKLNNAKLA